MQVCSGLPISHGLAAGKIVFLGVQKAAVRQAVSPQEEQLRFESAQRQAVDALGALYEKARAELGEKDAEIFSVHQLMAEDEDFTDLVSEAITDGAEAAEAVRQAGEQCAAIFSAMDDDYMRERAADVRDVAARICRILNGEAEQTITEPCLIAAEELTPSQTVQFPREFVRGMLTARGAANSHMGILARTLGVPAVSQLPVSAGLHGRTAVLDGFSGTLTLDPDEQTLAEANAKIAAQQEQREALRRGTGILSAFTPILRARTICRCCGKAARRVSGCSEASFCIWAAARTRPRTSCLKATKRSCRPWMAERSSSARWISARTSRSVILICRRRTTLRSACGRSACV